MVLSSIVIILHYYYDDYFSYGGTPIGGCLFFLMEHVAKTDHLTGYPRGHLQMMTMMMMMMMMFVPV